jgi:hypothetical protein
MIGLVSRTYPSSPQDDHLVPLSGIDVEESGPAANYRKLYQGKLFLTPGDVARYIHFPGASRTEVALSIYRDSRRPGGYWITVTQADKRIWDSISFGERPPRVDPKTIKVKRWDAPLPESTALAVRDVFLAMLRQMGPEPCPECVGVDRTTEIFSIRDADGKLLQGELPMEAKTNTLALLNLTNRLLDYTTLPKDLRLEESRKIEKAATELIKRVSSKQNCMNPASNLLKAAGF